MSSPNNNSNAPGGEGAPNEDVPTTFVFNALGNLNIASNATANASPGGTGTNTSNRPYSFNFNLVDSNANNINNEEEEDEDDEDFVLDMESYPKYLRTRLLFLKQLNQQREEILQNYVVERAALEAKFASLSQPLYDTRAKVVKGEMTDEEIAANLKHEEEDEEKDKEVPQDEEEEEEVVPGIPQFWVNAMGHMNVIAECITEQDIECLEHLVDVKYLDHPDGKGFTLYFYFRPNEFFENDVLTKRYDVPNFLSEEEPVLEAVKGCDIQWKAGKCLTFTEVKKTQRAKGGKKSGQIRTIIKKERQESFFHFFSPPPIPPVDDLDEEQAEAYDEAFDHDFDIAQAFRTYVIPKAVLWFTGEELLDDDDEDDDEDDDDDEHDDDDELQ
mmetsp:Transcript_26299/g.37687  ORF Transcript_26299/g.37687 Transcript_26299/m.37687 type:complete len:386 (-) Transcript_26299:157-1314(-)